MAFDVFFAAALLSGFLAITAWLQIRTSKQLQFQTQQEQFWTKVLADSTKKPQ
jgi:hypothetical protein